MKKANYPTKRILVQVLIVALVIISFARCDNEDDPVPEITYEEQICNAITDSLAVEDDVSMVTFFDPGASYEDYEGVRSFRHNPDNGTECILTPEPDSFKVYFKVGLPFNVSYHQDGTYSISNSSIDSVLTLYYYSANVDGFIPLIVYAQEVIHAEEVISSDILKTLCVFLNEDFGSSSVYTAVN